MKRAVSDQAYPGGKGGRDEGWRNSCIVNPAVEEYDRDIRRKWVF